MWIPADDVEHTGEVFLLRQPDGVICLGRWIEAKKGWFSCTDTQTLSGNPLSPTHALKIPGPDVPAPAKQMFQVSWRGCLPARIEATDARAAAIAFQEQYQAQGDAEIVVVSADSIESVFGYRQTIPTAHLDD